MESSRGYGQFCPVAMASEVVAQRWTPLILRELLAGATHFNELKRGLPLISRTTLAQRLRALESAGVVVAESAGTGRSGHYRLTPAGRQLQPVLEALGRWGQQWTARFEPHNLDPELLMWSVRRRLAHELLPAQRTLLRFEFRGVPTRYRRARVFWLFVQREAVDLCLKDPGHDVDLYIDADIETFARVWLGELRMQRALQDGGIRMSGPREMTAAFPRWLLLSPFAVSTAAATAASTAPAIS